MKEVGGDLSSMHHPHKRFPKHKECNFILQRTKSHGLHHHYCSDKQLQICHFEELGEHHRDFEFDTNWFFSWRYTDPAY